MSTLTLKNTTVGMMIERRTTNKRKTFIAGNLYEVLGLINNGFNCGVVVKDENGEIKTPPLSYFKMPRG